MVESTNSVFTDESLQFLADLDQNNNREWFQANKSRYESLILQPALDLISQLEKPIQRISPMLDVQAKRSGGSLMRIYRDTRFSPNKTPYKTNVGIHFRHTVGRDVHAPGLYIHIQPKQSFIGAGIWMPDGPTLAKLRTSIDQQPKRWSRILNAKSFAESMTLDTDSIKTVPRGYDKNHPLIDILRRKSHVGAYALSDAEVVSGKLPSIAVDKFKSAKAFMALLCESIGLPF